LRSLPRVLHLLVEFRCYIEACGYRIPFNICYLHHLRSICNDILAFRCLYSTSLMKYKINGDRRMDIDILNEPTWIAVIGWG
jgi:hypothetical protein